MPEPYIPSDNDIRNLHEALIRLAEISSSITVLPPGKKEEGI